MVKSNNAGFTLLDVFILLVVVAMIALCGLFIYKSHDRSSGSNVSSNVYSGWKSFTLPHERVSFKYPASWKIQNDNSLAEHSNLKSDAYELKAPNGFDLAIQAQAENESLGGLDIYLDRAAPVQFLGKRYYLDYFGLYRNSVTQAFLSGSATNINPVPVAPNNIAGKGSVTGLYINFHTANVSSGVGVPVGHIIKDSYFEDATLIIESFSD